MKQFFLFLIAIALFTNISAQNNLFDHLLNEKINDKNGGMLNSPEYRGPTNNTLEEALDLAFDSIANISPLKGFNAAINLPDGSVWKRAKGLASSGLQDSLNVNDAMGMGSTTKTFTAVTMLKLHEEGLVNINNPIGNYLPDFQYINPAITIHQLLQHTSGIYDYTSNPDFSNTVFGNPTHIWTPEEVVETFVLQPNFEPGTDWEYSNTNYLLAGMIIEAVTNQSYNQVVRSRILNPLGLAHTFFYPQESVIGTFADVWLDVDGNGTKEAVQDYIPLNGYFSAAFSAGAMVTTPEDLAYFFKKLLQQEILQASTYNEMFYLYPLEPSGVFGYGLGIYNSYSCSQLGWGHNGYIIYQSDNIAIPNEEISLAVLSNDGDNDPDKIGVDNMMSALEEVLCNYQPVSTKPVIESTISIFPNPADETLNINLAENGVYEFKITNITGNVLHVGNFYGKNQLIDITNLHNGVYILQLHTASGKYFQNIFIKN